MKKTKTKCYHGYLFPCRWTDTVWMLQRNKLRKYTEYEDMVVGWRVF